MLFVDRDTELAALTALARGTGGLAVVWGRRRIGKTRLLLEWCARERGIYTVADQSAPETQRAYMARALAEALPGFADVTYPDWDRLLARLASDAGARHLHGPIVFDELPYLIAASPELPSVLQRWVDHDARRAQLQLAVAGSSPRMMQGLGLSPDAPLYGRARVMIDLQPLAPVHMPAVLGRLSPFSLVEHWTAWGGVPRYWELAAGMSGSARNRLLDLALDPLGALFSEPERLLLEETPPALEVRALLDAIGAGAHRLSEIAGRLGRPATSLARPLDRLVGMGLVRREVPYGEPARGGKRSLYKIDDPFLRAWFRVVAPNRAALTAGSRSSRRAILDQHWAILVGQAWEDLCRGAVPKVTRGALARLGPWEPAQRYWRGAEPEWDIVADAVQVPRTLVAEVRFASKPVSTAAAHGEAERLAARPEPPGLGGRDVVRALFVPAVAAGVPRRISGVHVVTLRDLI
jgi:AAA+ ATPase superfamily predicted ATPase